MEYTTQQVMADHSVALGERSGVNFARTLANIARRAETLFEDGYTADRFAAGLYHVWGPQGQIYMVTCDDVVGHDCTCPAFAKFGECKHHLALAAALREPQAAQYDAQEADRDAFRFDVSEYEFRNFIGEGVN